MEFFPSQTHERLMVLPGFHMILSVAAFPSITFFSQGFGHQHDHSTEHVPEELTSFIWMNFGSEHHIGGIAMASGLEPCTVLTIGDSVHLTDHHPNKKPFWNYKACGHDLLYSKGALARWVRNVLRWHRLEFGRVQSLPNFPQQIFQDYMASFPREPVR